MLDDQDDQIRVGDRVVVSETGAPYVSQVGTVVSEDQTISWYYGMRVVLMLLESGLRIRIAADSLIRSPYQNERLEAVPSV